MATLRKASDVAKRALIFGVIDFRASLEVTTHPRTIEITEMLMPWLIQSGCDKAIDPLERELLETPFGKLSDSQRIDADWAGEGATYLCWCLGHIGQIDYANFADKDLLPTVIQPLQMDAIDYINSAALRPQEEIEVSCKRFVLIRSLLQESRIDSDSAKEIVRKANLGYLEECQISVAKEDEQEVEEIVKAMTKKQRTETAFLHVARQMAACWLFSTRIHYFED